MRPARLRSRIALATLAATLAIARAQASPLNPSPPPGQGRPQAAPQAPSESPAPASSQAGAHPPAGLGIDTPTLVGEGSLRWFGLKVYDARLWAGPGGIDTSRWQRTPFALELRYARPLEGAAIAAASAKEIERLGLGRGPRLDGWLDAMRRVFPDVRAGDRIAGVYRPGGGASFFLNGRSLGSIDDPEFASAFFAIWLDARSAAPELRAALLPDAGGRRRESM
ncbi:MAG: chalcone isomerase family protein [Burkholderiaceae bacterium]